MKLLVGAPGHAGCAGFARSVILLVGHSEKGAFGLIAEPCGAEEYRFPRFIRSFGIRAPRDLSLVNIHYGGPVSPDTGFVLHTKEHKFDVGYMTWAENSSGKPGG